IPFEGNRFGIRRGVRPTLILTESLPLLGGITGDLITLALISEGELNIGLRLGISVGAPQERRIPVFARRIPIKGIGHRVKKGGLATAGWAIDQKEPIAKRGEVDGDDAFERPKGR